MTSLRGNFQREYKVLIVYFIYFFIHSSKMTLPYQILQTKFLQTFSKSASFIQIFGPMDYNSPNQSRRHDQNCRLTWRAWCLWTRSPSQTCSAGQTVPGQKRAWPLLGSQCLAPAPAVSPASLWACWAPLAWSQTQTDLWSEVQHVNLFCKPVQISQWKYWFTDSKKHEAVWSNLSHRNKWLGAI